jgi:hypothetical protein
VTEFWAGFFFCASIGIIAGPVAIPYLGLLMARKLREWSRTPEEKEGANRPAPLLRKVVSFESSLELHLECGHEYELEVGVPAFLPCPKCTKEVESLKKMAGEK